MQIQCSEQGKRAYEERRTLIRAFRGLTSAERTMAVFRWFLSTFPLVVAFKGRTAECENDRILDLSEALLDFKVSVLQVNQCRNLAAPLSFSWISEFIRRERLLASRVSSFNRRDLKEPNRFLHFHMVDYECIENWAGFLFEFQLVGKQ